MAWNDDGNDRDPWGGRRNDDGPPDLDEVVKKMQDKIGGIFGGRRSSTGRDDGPQFMWVPILIGIVALLAYEMVWRIEPAERGVVMRFGKYVDTLLPGPHVRLPRPFEEVIKINVQQIRPFTVDATMLTGDENIVDVEMAVQYRIKNVKNYLFLIADPDSTVNRAAESAIRDIIGQSTLDFVITEGRAQIAADATTLIQTILDNYQSGIEVTSVSMQPAKPPEQVKAAFDDAIKAREDEQRRINEAEAYRNEVVEKTQGEAARILLEAEAYKEQVIAEATGEAERFNKLLVEYNKAPAVTRKRLYIETVEEVFAGNSKIMLDSGAAGGSNSLLYLPLDKMMERSSSQSGGTPLRDLLPSQQGLPEAPASASRDRTNSRMRGAR